MRLALRTPLTALALAFVASACSDSPTQPEALSADLTAALSEISVSTMVPASLGTRVPFAGAMPLVSPQSTHCAFASSTQSFVCAPMSLNGVTIERGFTLLSASGAPQSAFERGSTAAIRSTSSVTGTMTYGADVLTIDQHETMTLSGLLTGDHVLDGTQVAHFTSTTAGRMMDETVNTTIAGLRPPAAGSSYPRSGTVTTVVSSGSLGGVSIGSSTLVMTFNGTSTVTLTITTGGVTQHCTLNMAGTGAMACA